MKSLSTLLLPAMVLLSSCLNTESESQLTEERALNNATNLYITSVASLYNNVGGTQDGEGLQGTYRGVYDYNTFTTDEAIIPIRGGDWYDGGFWQNLYLHKWTADDPELQTMWNYLFRTVMRCNHSLELLHHHKQLLTPSQQMAYSSEVRALRALFYYQLMDLFARVPLVTNTETAVERVQPRSRSEIFRFVVDELQAALPHLSAAHSNLLGNHYGRLTRPVAQFLLARLALNAEVYMDDDWTDSARPNGASIRFAVGEKSLNTWQTVVAYTDSLAASGYVLEPSYAGNFAVANEHSQENIFTIPMDKTLYANSFKNLFRTLHYIHGGALARGAENGSSATRTTLAAFGYATPAQDPRFALNFFADTVKVDGRTLKQADGEALVYHPEAIRLQLTGSEYEKTAGARMYKYEIDRTAYDDGKLQNNDIVLYRYADALLMRAEAQIRQGASGDAALNAVRARVGLPALSGATLEDVLKERLLELVWEGTRRQDLVRFHRFHLPYEERPQLEKETNAYTTVFPIPARSLQMNRLLKQNPGY